jgi:hypothetical protein
VKKIEKEEIPLASIERSIPLLILIILASTALMAWGITLLKDVNPRGFLVLIPGGILSFQSLWLLLHPFALIYEDKIEIRQSFLHSRISYFVDVKKITQSKNGSLYITYNDDEVEKINLFGIRESQRSFLKDEFNRHVVQSLETRL